jgi:hypothetical protein
LGAEGLGAGRTGADGAEMVVAVDAGGMAVGERELDGVVSDGVGGFGGGLGLEHGENGGRSRTRGGEGGFLFALVVAGGAGTFVAEIGEVVVAGVAVGPGDVHTSAGGDVNFYAGGFFSWIKRSGHRKRVDSSQFTVERVGKKKDKERKKDLTQRALRSEHRGHGD